MYLISWSKNGTLRYLRCFSAPLLRSAPRMHRRRGRHGQRLGPRRISSMLHMRNAIQSASDILGWAAYLANLGSLERLEVCTCRDWHGLWLDFRTWTLGTGPWSTNLWKNRWLHVLDPQWSQQKSFKVTVSPVDIRARKTQVITTLTYRSI